MGLAFVGKGLAAIGWAVMCDAAPKQITGLAGGVFNAVSAVAGGPRHGSVPCLVHVRR